MDQTETKSINLKILPCPIITNNLSDLQKSERLIARTANKLNQSYFNARPRQIKIYLKNTRTPDSDGSQTNHSDRKSCTATTKSL